MTYMPLRIAIIILILVSVPKMYQLTVIIFNPSGAPNVSFELYESNNYFRQGQIIASYEISGGEQTIPFNLSHRGQAAKGLQLGPADPSKVSQRVPGLQGLHARGAP